ncbi:MAG: pyrroline-5-carboxylate reductase dimerization domain-containing protein, partial [Anaerovoracaceae bacterium]
NSRDGRRSYRCRRLQRIQQEGFHADRYKKNLLGVAMVLDETGDAPKERVSEMCSPGGVTIEGYKSLIHEGFAKAVMTSVKKAVDKANSI